MIHGVAKSRTWLNWTEYNTIQLIVQLLYNCLIYYYTITFSYSFKYLNRHDYNYFKQQSVFLKLLIHIQKILQNKNLRGSRIYHMNHVTISRPRKRTLLEPQILLVWLLLQFLQTLKYRITLWKILPCTHLLYCGQKSGLFLDAGCNK